MPGYRSKIFQDYKGSASIFSIIEEKMKTLGDKDIIRLHIGDTCFSPPDFFRPDAIDPATISGYNLYCDTKGIESLRTGLCKKLEEDNSFSKLNPGDLLVTCGATHGLFCTFKTLLDKNERVIVLAPHWPIINGVIRNAGGIPFDVPLYTNLYINPELDIQEYLKSYLSESTAAIYINSPNNPSGKVLSQTQLSRIGDFARRHGLWVVSDEAYEHFIYNDASHTSIATLEGMYERTVSVFSFSKTFAVAGYRIGYVAAPPHITDEIGRVAVNSIYGASTLLQHMAAAAITERSRWIAKIHKKYLRMRNEAADLLACDFDLPDGGFYFFVDLSDYIDDGGMSGLVGRLLEEGVSVTPGEVFGSGFENHVRVCFTGEPLERLRMGIERLNNVLTERSGS